MIESDNEDLSSAESHSEESDDSSSEEEESFKGELSMEELLKMREKVGSKIFDKKFASHVKKKEDSAITTSKTRRADKNAEFIRKNKNRPQEMSSKKRPGIQRNKGNSTQTRDPRFDELCGSKFDKDLFETRFSFLSDFRDKEKRILHKKLKKTKNPEYKKKLKYLIQRMENQERERNRKKEEKEIIQKWRRDEKLKVEKGKKPYFLKESEKKKLISEHRKQKKQEKTNQSKKEIQ